MWFNSTFLEYKERDDIAYEILEYLLKLIKMLLDMTEKMCKDKIESFDDFYKNIVSYETLKFCFTV